MRVIKRFLVLVSGAYTGLVLVLVYAVVPLAIAFLFISLMVTETSKRLIATGPHATLSSSFMVSVKMLALVLLIGGIVAIFKWRIRSPKKKHRIVG